MFPLVLATPVSRFLAWIVDVFVIAVLGSALGAALMFFAVISLELHGALFTVGYFIISIGYAMFMEWRFRGQTIGKRVLGLRVMDEQGLHLSAGQIILRNLMRFVDMLPGPYMLGGLCCFFSSRSQRLGDMAANTVVVVTPKIYEPDLDQILQDKFNSLRDYPHLAARLRQQTSQDLAGIAASALLRRDTLAPVDRLELFQAIGKRLKSLVKFPQKAVDGLSDEQYLKNAVDILFRS